MMIRSSIRATAGISRSKTLARVSHRISARSTIATGTAKITASRLRPAYHCPRPGHRNESAAAIVGDRRVERLERLGARRAWETVLTTRGVYRRNGPEAV